MNKDMYIRFGLAFLMGAFVFFMSAIPVRAAEVDCQMCHADLAEGKSVHAALGMGCTVCHTGVDASAMPHKFTSGVDKGLSAAPPELCMGCHDPGKFQGMKTVHMPVAAGMCTSCHNPHSSDQERLLRSAPPGLCMGCHDAGSFERDVMHPPVAGGMCTGCHEPHQSDQGRLLKSAPPELCYGCHQKERFVGPTVHAPVGIGSCTSCHEAHSSTNVKLLVSGYEDLCFNCHDREKFTGTSVHEPVTTGGCLYCHRPHAGQNEDLLRRRGNFLCRRCHSKVERAPHAVAGFYNNGHPLRGRRDPVREGKTFGCLSCHQPHASESQSLFRYKADNVFMLCSYCHDM